MYVGTEYKFADFIVQVNSSCTVVQLILRIESNANWVGVALFQGVIKLGEKIGESKCTLVYGQMNEPPGARARVALTGRSPCL